MNLRQFARKLVINIGSLVSTPKNGIFILNGHYLKRSATGPSSVFLEQLKKLRNSYDFVNIDDAVKLIKSRDPQISSFRSIAFTFDDGFSDCFQSIAPALDHFNVNAAFFINPGFVDGDSRYINNFTKNIVRTFDKVPMSWSEIKKLHEAGFVIGNHTLDHLRLSECSIKEFEKQVLESKVILEEKLDYSCKYFAWPYGQERDIELSQIDKLSKYHEHIFSGCNSFHYLSYSDSVINRRHFEPDWPAREVKFFLSKGRRFAGS